MRERVLNYILRFGSINTKQAFIDLGCTRLSEYIRQLRLTMNVKDRIITGKNRFGENVWWKEYYLDDPRNNDKNSINE